MTSCCCRSARWTRRSRLAGPAGAGARSISRAPRHCSPGRRVAKASSIRRAPRLRMSRQSAQRPHRRARVCRSRTERRPGAGADRRAGADVPVTAGHRGADRRHRRHHRRAALHPAPARAGAACRASLKAGDSVRLDAGRTRRRRTANTGRITLVYPQIEDGRVIADAGVAGSRRLFRRRAHACLDRGRHPRGASSCPRGSDRHARSASTTCVCAAPMAASSTSPVQRGADGHADAVPDGMEILSGLAAGDVLVQP